jgi:predicted dehydrogenase
VEETYGHTPSAKALAGDVYGVAYDADRAGRRALRLGCIGAGGVFQSKYLPALLRLRVLWEPVELVAVADPAREQVEKVRRLWPVRWYADHRQMLAREDLDAVLVLSADEGHAEQAAAALATGCPVLVEKPLARSLKDAEELCRLADDRGLPLMAVANKRWSPPYRQAKRLLDRGVVSDPALFAGKFTLGYDYVDLLESGTIHLFDLARYFLGDVGSVLCQGVRRRGDRRRPYPFDHAVVVLSFRSGALGVVHTSSDALSFQPWERVEVFGRKAWFHVEDQRTLTLYAEETGPAKTWEPVVPNTLCFDEEFGGYLGQLEHFLQVVRGEEPPLVTGWDGLRAYELVVACHLSMARGGPVSLPLASEDADRESLAWLHSHGWPGAMPPPGERG